MTDAALGSDAPAATWQPYYPWLLLVAITGLTQLAGLQEVWRYQPGESLWRLLSSHFVHGSAEHWLMNVGSQFAAFYLFPELGRWRNFLFLLLLSVAGVSLGLWLFDSDIGYYQGFSGAYYGLLGGIAVISYRRNAWALWVLLFVVGKITLEQWQGEVWYDFGRVAIQAHLYGFISGLIAAVLLRLCDKYTETALR